MEPDQLEPEEDLLPVIIMDPRRTEHRLNIDPEWMLREFKIEIRKGIPGISRCDFNLSIDGSLLNDASSLNDQGIYEDWVVTLVIIPKIRTAARKPAAPAGYIQINVKSMNGTLHRLNVDPKGTVKDLKAVFSVKSGQNIENQVLYHKGKPLNDETKVLNTIPVQPNDNIQFVRRVQGGFCL